jgi:hypothetical protein
LREVCYWYHSHHIRGRTLGDSWGRELGEYTVNYTLTQYTYALVVTIPTIPTTPSRRGRGERVLLVLTILTYYSKYYTAARLLNPGTTSNLVRRTAEVGTDMHIHTYTTLSPVRLLCELELYDNTLWPVRGKRISSTSIHSMAPRPIERTQCTLLLYLSLESSSMILSLSLSPG